MKRFLTALALASLAGCTGMPAVSVPSSPAAIADRTAIDEQTAIAFELAYQAAGEAIVAADKAGLLNPAAKARLRIANRQAWAAVTAVRAAYRAGNATGFMAATAEARSALSALVQALKGE